MSDPVVGVGILGCGNVGGALIGLLQERSEDIGRRTSTTFEIRKVAVRSRSKERSVHLNPELITDDALSVVSDPSVDVVVELMGGIEPARGLVVKALELGKPVVTANKELIANVGAELSTLAQKNGVDLLYEAAVGGGIPIVRPLRESLAGENISRIMGIVNGTTNYILTRMTEENIDYASALAEAQSHGFAERDPSADVEGLDAAAKAAILANIAFGANVVAGDVYREGISTVSKDDIVMAARLGYVVKLLAIVERGAKNRVGVRVHPTMIPVGHALASVRLSFNALFVEGDSAGELMFYGRGAGGAPTASAVLGDLIDAAHNKMIGKPGRILSGSDATLWPIDDQSSAFYVAIDVADRAGVLANVAATFGAHDVSIRSMEQVGLGKEARLIFITHTALEGNMRTVLHELRSLDSVQRLGNVMRVMEHG